MIFTHRKAHNVYATQQTQQTMAALMLVFCCYVSCTRYVCPYFLRSSRLLRRLFYCFVGTLRGLDENDALPDCALDFGCTVSSSVIKYVSNCSE